MYRMSASWFKNIKNVGKFIFALGGFLYPLTLIINTFVNEKLTNGTATLITYLLVIWFAYIFVPFMCQTLRWDLIWSTIFAVAGIVYLVDLIVMFNSKMVLHYFLIIFIAHLVVGSSLWMIESVKEYYNIKKM